MEEKLTTGGTIYPPFFVQALSIKLKRNLAPKFSRAMDSNPGLFPFSFPSYLISFKIPCHRLLQFCFFHGHDPKSQP
jgi:hypothetical protein